MKKSEFTRFKFFVKNVSPGSVLLLAVFLLSLQSCGTDAEAGAQKSAPPARPFPVVEVETRDVASKVAFPAELDAQNNAQVRPRISGYITNIFVEEGSRVQKGQKIMQLETNILNEEARSAKAQIGVSEANVSTAQVEVDRLRPLVEKGIISDVQLKTAEAQLNQAQAQLNQTKAAYQSVLENIRFAEIHSPVTGIVGKLNFRVGSLVSPQDPQPITTISDTRVIQAYFTVNESRYLNFFTDRPGKTIEDKIASLPPVELQLANGSIYSEKGKIITTTGQIDQATGTMRFRADFKNDEGLLSDGNTGTVLIPRVFSDALVIPEAATYEQQGVIYTYKVQQDSVLNTPVKVLSRIDNMALIESGLKSGDVVVAKGVINLQNGMKISPQPTSLDSLTHIKTVK